MARFKKITVHENDINQRVDRFIRNYFKGLSLSRIHFLFRKKEIKVNGKPVKKNHSLQSGDELICYGLTEEEWDDTGWRTSSDRSPKKFRLPIIHEDEDLLVIDKPTGIAVHPGSNIREGKTVIEQVTEYLGVEEGSLFKPSLIHRLDKDTSGVLLVAKSGKALRWWTLQFREKKIHKYYYAMIPGQMKNSEGIMKATLKRISSSKGGAKTVVDESDGKESRTEYWVEKKWDDYSLLKLKLITGRMHQIRAHLQAEGKAILGDDRYGDFTLNKSLKKNFGLSRLFLHAFEFQGRDWDGRRVLYKSIISKDLSDFIEALSS